MWILLYCTLWIWWVGSESYKMMQPLKIFTTHRHEVHTVREMMPLPKLRNPWPLGQGSDARTGHYGLYCVLQFFICFHLLPHNFKYLYRSLWRLWIPYDKKCLFIQSILRSTDIVQFCTPASVAQILTQSSISKTVIYFHQ